MQWLKPIQSVKGKGRSLVRLIGIIWVLLMGYQPLSVWAALASKPFASQVSATPKVMLLLSKAHELFKKAYSDYTDLNGDGALDTTYDNSITYDGYFNSALCYSYDGNMFTPSAAANNHLCSGAWSGNFLNWGTMSRMDLIRKVLYGGRRYSDPTAKGSYTVLERAFLPDDVHAFAKVFRSTTSVTVSQVSPYSQTAITLCNASQVSTLETRGSKKYPPASKNAPLIHVAKGAWPFWATQESRQCQYAGGEQPSSGDKISSSSPFKARVQVCNGGLDNRSGYCEQYPAGTIKPVGLLQRYGETGKIEFGLISGSYYKYKKGGVLRKPLEAFNTTDSSGTETDTDTGVLLKTDKNTSMGTNDRSIIGILDSLQIIGRDDSSYVTYSCGWNGGKDNDGDCVDWENPLGEMYLEALRYLTIDDESQRTPSSDFAIGSNDQTYFTLNLFRSTSWGADPWPAKERCASCSILILSSGVNTYDADQMFQDDNYAGLSINAADLTTYIDKIGTAEGINGGTYLIGEASGGTSKRCDSKTIAKLSAARGICPDAPAAQGSYGLAGLAYYAHTQDLKTATGFDDSQTIKTYGVALSEALPLFSFKTDSGSITLVPRCYNQSGGNDCSMNDVVIADQQFDGKGNISHMRFFVAWEDGVKGGDYDMDMVEEFDVCVGSACNDGETASNQLKVTVGVPYRVTSQTLTAGYLVIGSTASSAEQNVVTVSTTIKDWVNLNNYTSKYSDGDASTTPTYAYGTSRFVAAASSAITTPPSPLYLAAKYGGFNDHNGDLLPGSREEWDKDGDGSPDSYFKVNNFSELADYLNDVFSSVATSNGYTPPISSSSAVRDGSYIFVSTYDNTYSWNGDLVAYQFNDSLTLNKQWSAATQLENMSESSLSSSRQLLSWDNENLKGVAFRAGNTTCSSDQTMLNCAQLTRLIAGQSVSGNAATVQQRAIDYLRGSHTQEVDQGGVFRNRKTKEGKTTRLGDIVDSVPVYVGSPNFGYTDALEGSSHLYSSFRSSHSDRSGMVYVGANDGLMHGFSAATGKEVFAYAPNAALDAMAAMLDPDYDSDHSNDQHQYSVDGSPTIVDAFFNDDWHTVLTAGMRAGGKAVFALDVSSPASVNESNASQRVLWEYDEAVDKALFADASTPSTLGYTFSKPAVIRLHNNRWAVAFGNGYESSAGSAVLYLVYLDAMQDQRWNKADVVRIDTSKVSGIASSARMGNGLSNIAPVDYDGDGNVDYIYAGDLKGNLWKFDLRSADSSDWQVAQNAPLFVATTTASAGTVQPIFAQPELGFTSQGLMIYIGTGKYHDVGDNLVSNIVANSLYGIRDDSMSNSSFSFPVSRASLTAQTFTSYSESGTTYRQISSNAVGSYGWRLDLDSSAGEMVINTPLLRRGRIIYSTLIPNPNQCGAKEYGWLMALKAKTGGGHNSPIMDTNGDGVIDSHDSNAAGVLNKDSTGALIMDSGKGAVSAYASDGSGGLKEYQIGEETYRTGRVNWKEVYPGQ